MERYCQIGRQCPWGCCPDNEKHVISIKGWIYITQIIACLDRNDFGVIQRFLKQERPAESSFAACEPDRSR
jgi:hypothetical protein